MSNVGKKTLIFRLSSLGDVILASTVLNSMKLSEGEVEWVVLDVFAPVLRGHPRITFLHEYEKKTGLIAWLRLCSVLHARDFREVYDLHASLRTRLARVVFFALDFWKIVTWPWFNKGEHGFSLNRRTWKTINKQRLKRFAYFAFKGIWPVKFRPQSIIVQNNMCVSGHSPERGKTYNTDLRHMLNVADKSDGLETDISDIRRKARDRLIVAVMPDSKWLGKCWPIAHYVALLKQTKDQVFPVVFGLRGDERSQALCNALTQEGIDHASGLGRWTLIHCARVLSEAGMYLGSDTGLAHMAESLGTRAVVLFGPTCPDMGFAPWRHDSVSLGADVWCRPCGKDGRFCYRPINKYLCMEQLSPSRVAEELSKSYQRLDNSK